MARLTFEIQGSKTTYLSCDTQEFAGLDIDDAVESVIELLSGIDDSVYWNTDDVVLAAETLIGNGEEV